MDFLNYSGLMDADLKSLEAKVVKLIELCESLRNENTQLRQDVVRLNQDGQTLKNNMAQASAQLEQLLAALPNEKA